MDRDERVKRIDNILAPLFDAAIKEEEIWISRLAKQRLSKSEIRTLVAINESGFIPMTQIAKRLRITISTLTTAINKLEKRNLVEKVRDEDDKRIIKVKLTSKGKIVAEKHDDVRARMVGKITGDFEEEELEVLEKALGKMLAYLNKRQ